MGFGILKAIERSGFGKTLTGMKLKMMEPQNKRVKPSEAYRAGRLAQLQGKARKANPHEKSSPLFGAWDHGWKDRNRKSNEVQHEPRNDCSQTQ